MFKFLVIASATVLSIVSSHPFHAACIGKCPKSNDPFEIPTLLGHQDCTKYCICDNGCPRIKTCQGNFHFSLDDRMCLPVELAKCDDRRNCLGMCPLIYNPHNVLILAHQNSNKYCHCREWGIPIVETCPESFVFNLKYAQCQKPNPDCNNIHHKVNETGGPTVRSTGIKLFPTTVAPVPTLPPSDIDKPTLIITNEVPTSTSAYNYHDRTTITSISIDDVTTTTTILPTVASHNDYSTTPVTNNQHETTIVSKEESTTTLKSDIDVVIPIVTPTFKPISEFETTVASKIDDSTTLKPKIDVVIPIVTSTLRSDSKVETTVAPKIDHTTTLKPKIDVVIPIVTSTLRSDSKVETTEAPKIDHTTTLKPKIDVVIPIVTSTLRPNSEVETTVASKIDVSITPKAPSNKYNHKISIVPCNCTQIVYVVDNNIPKNTEKVNVDNYISTNSSDCIGQCPVENDAYHSKQLPHKDCSKFCKCDWGNATVMDCPYNLHFNTELEVCDYPSNAKCTGIGAIIDNIS